MKGRIQAAFAANDGRPATGFIPFISAGDPDMDTTVEIVVMLGEKGATVVELGVPFTDPMADGPVIQRSSQRALERGGVDIASILSAVRRIRERSDVPIVLFGYLNPFHSYGIERFCRDAAAAGVDGLLVTDIVDREFAEMSGLLADHGMDLISLVAPTTTDERLRTIVASARGFIYAVSRTGVTGKGAEIMDSAESLVKRVRAVTELPVAVGFGVSNADQVRNVREFADAAVVGSAIVRVIEQSEGEDVVQNVAAFVDELTRDG